jgi:hypothetical protein
MTMMKKMFMFMAALMFMVSATAFAANPVNYFAEVRNELGASISDATVEVFVYDAGTKTLSTIYSNDALTAKTNPITTTVFNTDNRVSFWSTAASHDVFINTKSGDQVLVAGLTANDHSITINRSSPMKHLVVPFSGSSASEVDTGWDLPLGAIVTDAIVEVVTTASAKTVSLGLLSTETAGDADGFLAAVLETTAGYVENNPVITGGANIDFTAATTYGVLLATAITGSDAVATNGGFARKRHVVTGSNATSISYTRSDATSSAGYFHIFYTLGR